jgi:hypothetical protein
MPNFPTKFYCLVSDKDKGVHHLDRDLLAFMLTNALPDQKFETPDQIREITSTASRIEGGIIIGYPKGGIELVGLPYSSVAGITKMRYEHERALSLQADDSAIGPFRYMVIFNKTAMRLMCWHDHGGERIIPPGRICDLDQGPDGFYVSE